jgi:hypothetical protein
MGMQTLRRKADPSERPELTRLLWQVPGFLRKSGQSDRAKHAP